MYTDDPARLRHMLNAARAAQSFMQGKIREDLDNDLMLALAVVKSIEIVGEAASKISEATRNQYPEIPWRQIIAMRNRLTHAYFDVDLSRVWDTVTTHLPPLIAALEQIVPSEDQP